LNSNIIKFWSLNFGYQSRNNNNNKFSIQLNQNYRKKFKQNPEKLFFQCSNLLIEVFREAIDKSLSFQPLSRLESVLNYKNKSKQIMITFAVSQLFRNEYLMTERKNMIFYGFIVSENWHQFF
jgi:hypothetical protein